MAIRAAFVLAAVLWEGYVFLDEPVRFTGAELTHVGG
jgi:hypothetical protein